MKQKACVQTVKVKVTTRLKAQTKYAITDDQMIIPFSNLVTAKYTRIYTLK